MSQTPDQPTTAARPAIQRAARELSGQGFAAGVIVRAEPAEGRLVATAAHGMATVQPTTWQGWPVIWRGMS